MGKKYYKKHTFWDGSKGMKEVGCLGCLVPTITIISAFVYGIVLVVRGLFNSTNNL